MPSMMQSACGSRNCHWLRKRSSARCAPRPAIRLGISEMATRTINFTLNGRAVSAEVAPHHNLVEVLQAQFALTGARESCGQGLCGCCTVLLDGKPVSGCLYLAAFADGSNVVTIEHLGGPNDSLDPVQEAFIENSA